VAADEERIVESTAGRRTRARLKELLLQAGEEVLDRDGLGFNTDTITYKAVFAHLEESQGIRVTRGSVHERIWDRQRDFQLEVLQRAVQWRPERSTEVLVRAATGAIEAGELGTEAGRWATARTLVRDAAREVYTWSDAEDHWPQWIGLILTLVSGRGAHDAESQKMVEGARQSYHDRTEELSEIYRGFLRTTGVRVRPTVFPDPDEAVLVMTRLLTAVADGLAMRERFDPGVVQEVELLSAEGTRDSWHPYSLAAWALVRFFLEPDPEDGS
jgi:hypothetical protein